MVLNGKECTSLRLHCPLKCGGYIENEVLMYLTEDSKLFLYGKCCECGHGGDIEIDLMELLMRCPVTMAVM
jgi:hypothetical protein